MPAKRIHSGIVAGHIASLTSAVALAALGWVERRRPAGPLNGPSQWLWDTPAAEVQHADVKHTVVGCVVHHAMSIFWAVVHEQVFPRRQESVRSILAKAAATSAFACFADYRLAPRRLQPGFDRQLSRTSLTVVYAAFACGLAAARIFGRNK